MDFLAGLLAGPAVFGWPNRTHLIIRFIPPPGPIAKRESRPMHETPLMVEEALIIVKAQVIEVR